MIKYILFPLFLLAGTVLFAQKGTVTEAEIKIQETFLDGNREKLLGNWDKAAEKFKEVLSQDNRNDAAAYELARAYEALKDMDKAVASAKNATTWNPGNKWYKIYLAELYLKTNKDKDAAAIYENLVKSEPGNEEYYFKWAYFLVRSGQPESAIKVYDDLEKMMGVNEEVIRHKHTLYVGMGNYKKASKELEKLIETFPEKPAYHHLLATFYEQIGEKAKAKETYEKILSINPEDARAKIALAEKEKGRDDIGFLNSLKPVFENPDVNIDIKISEILPYVNSLADTGDRQLGNTLLGLTSILERVHPNNAKATSVLGDVLYYTGQQSKALEKYKKTLELDDTVWLVWEQILYIHAENKNWPELVATSEKALDIFPNQAVAQYFNGLGYNNTDEYRDAVNSLQQALLMSGRNARLRYDVLNELGKAYFHLKQFARSNEAFEEALQLNPNEPGVLKNYSYCLAAHPSGEDNLAKARGLAERLNSLAPNVAANENALAFVFYKMKDYKTAKSWLDKALQHGGENSPAVLELYGDVIFQLGNTTEAIQYWQKALEMGGKSAFLEKKVREGKLFE